MSGPAYERVKNVVLEARHLSGAARDAYLDRVCAGDEGLRLEVESLLPHGDAPGLLDQGTPPVSSGALARIVEAAADKESAGTEASDYEGFVSRLPKNLGPFRIIRLIARGGMGTVYEAEQEDPKRRVALKTLRPDLLSPSLARRFQLESRILGILKHPGIAQVYEAGTVDDGGQELPYFSMELIEGQSLLEWASERELDTDGRLTLFARVCDAVEHAHLQGVIHRDLKPDNILVTNDGHPKVLDFGVARVTDADVEAVTMMTQAGQIMGTLAYMSPEQVAGDPDKLDLRSDVYALGAVLFELLSGRKPHDLARRTLPEATRIIRDEDATRLGSVDTRFRGDLETIVGTALEKDVGHRYVSAAALAEDIRRHQAQLPIGARPPSSFYQLRKFAQRHTGLVVGVSIAFVALISGLVLSLNFAIDEAQQRSKAESAGYRALIAASMAALDDEQHLVARPMLGEAPEALRGWEWHHAAARAEPLLWELPLDLSPPQRWSHTFPAFAFSPDGMRLAALVADDRVDVFEAETGARQQSLQLSGPMALNCLVATAAGFVTMTRYGHVAHWDGQTGELLRSQAIPALDVSGKTDHTFMTWDETNRRLAVLGLVVEGRVPFNLGKLYLGPVGSLQRVDTGTTNHYPLAWTNDGEALVTRTRRDSAGVGVMVSDVVMDDAGAPTLRQRNRLNAGSLYDGHGDRLLLIPAGANPDTVAVVDFEGRELLRLDPHPLISVIHGAFSRDGRRIVTSSGSGERRSVTVFDAASGRALTRWPGSSETLGALSPTGKLLAMGDPDRLGRTLARLPGHDGAPCSPWLRLRPGLGSGWTDALGSPLRYELSRI